MGTDLLSSVKGINQSNVFWSVGGRMVSVWVICKESDVTPESQIDGFEPH